MNNTQKFNKAIERKRAIESELKKIVSDIVDVEGTARERLTKKHGELSAELDLLTSEMAIYHQRIQEEKQADYLKMVEAKKAELAKKEGEFTAENKAHQEAVKSWESFKGEIYYNRMTPELAERGAKIQHDLYLHEQLKRILYEESLFLQGQLREMGIK